MFINKQRNRHVTQQNAEIADHFCNLFPDDHYIGDDLLINNCNLMFQKDQHFKEIFSKKAKAPIYQQMAWRVHILDFFFNYAKRGGIL